MQQQLLQQASQAAAIAAAAACSTVVLDGPELAADDLQNGSLFEDVLAAAGLPSLRHTLKPVAGAELRSRSDIRSIASAVSTQVASATAALVLPSALAAKRATASVVGAVGTAASSVGSAAASVTSSVTQRIGGFRASAAALSVDLRERAGGTTTNMQKKSRRLQRTT